MSIRDGKAKADRFVGRVEEIIGESYADPAAEIHGEALRLRGEAEEDAELAAQQRVEEAVAERRRSAAEKPHTDDGTGSRRG